MCLRPDSPKRYSKTPAYEGIKSHLLGACELAKYRCREVLTGILMKPFLRRERVCLLSPGPYQSAFCPLCSCPSDFPPHLPLPEAFQ